MWAETLKHTKKEEEKNMNNYEKLELVNAYLMDCGDTKLYESLEDLKTDMGWSDDTLSYYKQSNYYDEDKPLVYIDSDWFVNSTTWDFVEAMYSKISLDYQFKWLKEHRYCESL